jgi:hypothetical protein
MRMGLSGAREIIKKIFVGILKIFRGYFSIENILRIIGGILTSILGRI